MQVQVEGAARVFTPLKVFRAEQGLPDGFSVDHFQPKDWVGLGRIDAAGAELNRLRDGLLAALPGKLTALAWLQQVPGYVGQFEAGLRAINPQVGLREPEIGFAVAGFSDVLNAHSMALIGKQAGRRLFAGVYDQWLHSSVRVFADGFPYSHRGENWQVQVISHAYGRIGLRVTTAAGIHYVYDPALACPAEGYMYGLLEAICTRVEAIIFPQL
jgi:hypothetical protein